MRTPSVGTKNGTTERNPNFRRIVFADGPQRPSRQHASQACSTLQQSSAVAVVSRVGAAEPTPPPRAPPCACEEEEKLCGPLAGATAARLPDVLQQPRGRARGRSRRAAKGDALWGRFVRLADVLSAPARNVAVVSSLGGGRHSRVGDGRRRDCSRRRTPKPRG